MKSIRKTTIYMVLASATFTLVALVLSILFIRQAQSALQAEKINYLQELSLKCADNINKQVSGYRSTVDAIATYIGSTEDFDITTSIPILKAEAAKNCFKRMGIIFPSGAAYTTDGYSFDFSEREYFKNAMQGQSAISDCLVDKIDGGEINVFASPIIKDDRVIGVIFGTKSQEQFSDAMTISSFDGEGYIYIISGNGKPIVKTTHPDSLGAYANLFDAMEAHGMHPESGEKLKSDIAHNLSGSFENFRDGKKSQICYTPVGINDWYVLSVVPSRVISHQSDMLIVKLSFITAIILFVFGFVGFLIIHGFRKNNRALEKIAYVDPITGFASWAKFSIDTHNTLERNPETQFAMIVFDINKFKIINDLFGYDIGNSVLRSIADILKELTHEQEAFARVYADNFNVLMRYDGSSAITSWLDQLLERVAGLLPEYRIELSAGVYLIPKNNSDINAASDRANFARNIAETQNTAFYHFFTEETRQAILKEKEVENAMNDALANHEFKVYLQPKYRLSDGEIVGAEALVRWQRGDKLVPPMDFIPLFEKNGFIRKLDLYMFEQACLLLERWAQGVDKSALPPISVNISQVHLSDSSLPQKLLIIARSHRVPTELLEIELTESAVYRDVDNVIALMHGIKDAGFALSIDDFGSGYSSLGMLKRLPVDFVKIDKSFLDNAVDDARGAEIVASVVHMSRILSLKTVAEGVETKWQAEFLKRIGCDIAQGYFYSRPIAVADFERLAGLPAGAQER